MLTIITNQLTKFKNKMHIKNAEKHTKKGKEKEEKNTFDDIWRKEIQNGSIKMGW